MEAHFMRDESKPRSAAKLLRLKGKCVCDPRRGARNRRQVESPDDSHWVTELLLLFLVLFLQDCGSGDGIVLLEPQQTHTLRRAAGLANFVRVHANHFAV